MEAQMIKENKGNTKYPQEQFFKCYLCHSKAEIDESHLVRDDEGVTRQICWKCWEHGQ